jgi:hypothetical protein
MVAGVAALLLGEGGFPDLWHEREGEIKLGKIILPYNSKPYQMMKSVLALSATDVTTGTSCHGDSANAGYDDATGYGLVNAKNAFDLATSAGCLIATAAYGSPFAPEVQFLRNIRDKKLRRTAWGNKAMDTFERIYYKFSPVVAWIMIQNTAIRNTVRWLAVAPIVHLLSLGVKIFSSLRDKFRGE